jgi:heavy metal translocating P-type ATPase
MVYSMLMAAADTQDPAHFKKSDLFKRCLAAGIIPASEDDLKQHTVTKEAVSFKTASAEEKVFSELPHLTLDLAVSGMWCPACAWVIDESLRRSDGIFSSQCNFAIDRLCCTYNPTVTSPAKIQKIIQNLGYQTHELDQEGKKGQMNLEVIRLLVSVFLGLNVMMLSLALYTGFFSKLSSDAVRHLSWPIFMMATIVVIYGGRPIFYKAFSGIKSKAPGMEVLISMGTFSAYAYSCYNFFVGSIHLYFDTATMLVVLTLLGKAIEKQTRKKVRHMLDNFFTLTPKKVCLITSDFPSGRYVDIAQLKTGDHFKVRADEIVAADGIVVTGQAQVDESALTGEARPVAVTCGSPLKSGTQLISDRIIVKATAVGPNATLGRMIDVIQRSLYQKTPLESQTDRILRYFTPAIIFLAIGTGLLWLGTHHSMETALIRAVTVMVIACPCALGIAIPMARVAGMAIAAKKGILVHEFSAFEQAGQIDTVVFDKTGTLTVGQWRLMDVETNADYDRKFILQLAAGLEQKSDHIVAAEIHRTVKQEGLIPFTVEDPTLFANGVSGYYQGKLFRLGNRRFVKALSEIATKGNNALAVSAQNISHVFLSTNEEVIARFLFGDRLRKTAETTVKQLYDQNMHIKMITGDDESTARWVAFKMGIKTFQANMLPLEKASVIDGLKASGHKVAMIGDGINDAPALSRADLSVAMATANPLTDHITHITLMRAEPSQLTDCLELAKNVTRKIRQNLWCALIYNLCSIPLAMIGWVSPLVAVIAMLISSLTVTGNTLLLMRTNINIKNQGR